MKIRWLIGGIFVLSWLTACGSSTTPAAPPAPTAMPVDVQTVPSPVASPQAAPTQPPTSAPVETAAPPTTAPVVAPTAVPALSQAPVDAASAPRLIVPSAEGLLLFETDGTRSQLFGDAQMSIGHDLSAGIAPQYGLVAYIGGDNPMTPDREGSGPLTLYLLDTRTATVKPITPLFSPEMEQALVAAQSGERNAAVEAGIAVAEMSDTLAWSPDGRYLAFIAAIDGPSSDVYSYDRETGQINRLTDGPNQAARLFWSPDSQWIIHEEIESFGTGAGYNVNAVWAAAPDNSGNRKLYDTEFSGDEIFVDWTAPDMLAVYTWSPIGLQNARLIDLASGEAQRIGPEFSVQAYALDPQSLAQLYALDDYTAQQNGLTGGLYLQMPGAPPQQVAAGNWYNVAWRPYAERFFAQGVDGVVSVALDGTVQNWETEQATLPIDSPDGAWLLAWGDGNYSGPIGLRLYTADGELKRDIASDSVMHAVWTPASDGVFYISEGSLVYVAIPNGEPQLVAEDLAMASAGSLGWVRP